MDNNDLSKIPVSELTPENIDSLKGAAPADVRRKAAKTPRRPEDGKNNRLLLLIVGILLLVGIAVALFFIFRKPSGSPDPTGGSDDGSAEVIWEPESGSENPSQDYINHHQSIIDDPDASFDDKLSSKLSIANLFSSNKEFDKASNVLNGINRSELNHRQTFNLYSAYAYLYECMNDSAANQEYLELARGELEKFWEEDKE